MIGRLRGQILAKQPPMLVIDVSGIGYEVEAPMSTFYDLPAVGETTSLFTHLAIREDAHVLYGFARDTERDLFRALLKVSGVGGKVALAILSGMNADEFALCIQSGDVASLTRLPGIGKKTAERLIVEMRDRLKDFAVGGAMPPGVGGSAVTNNPTSEAAGALVALGYRPADAAKMVKAVAADGLSSEAIIRAALQSVAGKG